MQTTNMPTASAGAINPYRRRGKYFIPDFVRGKVKNGPRNFRGFIRHHGISDTMMTKGFGRVHRTLAGLLNKKCLLFESDISYKTYLHCMKRAYKLPLSQTWEFIDFVRDRIPYEHQNSPWHRLCIFLLGKESFKIAPDRIPEKGISDATGVTVIDRNQEKSRRFPSTREIVYLPEGPAVYAGKYYGGPDRTLFRHPVEPTHFHDVYEDREKGAEDLLDLLSFSGLKRGSSSKYSTGISGPDISEIKPTRVYKEIVAHDSTAPRLVGKRGEMYDLLPVEDARDDCKPS